MFQYPDGWMEFVPLPGGYRVSMRPMVDGGFVALDHVDTWFPPEIVQRIAECHGFSWTGEVVARHQDPLYLERILKRQLFSYFPPSRFAGQRVLDFGCGTGASTFCLARLLPDSQVTGIDFDRSRLEVARRIAELSDWPNASFRLSPTALSLPPDLGTVDFIVLSATYQHMLPAERRKLMPLLWRLLKPGGALLVSQTPHRWYPVEAGVSGLALLNYLPVRVAAFLARHFSGRDEEANRERDLPKMLRAGLRGASEGEILDLLPANTIVMQPAVQHSRAEYWRESVGEQPGIGIARKIAAEFFRWTDRRWGAVPSAHLDVVIKKWGQ